jgi:general secretion pathway protein G
MKTRTRGSARGFSLIELVIVVVIIAIIGAIAIPKMSRGAQGAGDSALIQDLAVMRAAVDLYNTEHPTAQLSSSLTATQVSQDLTGYTDSSGTYSATKTATAIYGPYLKAVPNAPIGVKKGLNTILVGSTADGTTAWMFTGSDFKLNDTATTDASGTLYGSY